MHALIAALVIFGLPTLPQPQEEEVVSVTLEPPPKPPEPAKAAPPPPPPVAEPAKPPPPAPERAAAAPIPALNPVVKFGEKDAGPRQSLAGAGAEDNPDPPSAVTDEPKATDEARSERPDKDEDLPAAETGNETAEAAEPQQATGKADENTGSAADQLVATATTAPDKAAPPAPPPTPGKAKTTSEPRLKEARQLFSRSANGGPRATTAMANTPRSIRAGRLCVTELRLQLLNGGHFPDLLPSYRLEDGTVLAVQRSAYRRAGGAWRNLSFECQVDADATSVVSFAFRVGEPISREEVERRGLPSQ
ncbi:DUF930 domain-containing protein [Mesorhizobium sp. LHD-90]|uniref:DUF930 domain-containing protein n=1 Tax=Mesorhizobium sp. LHD-90 TaxID=3071414 RepID=UPI0027E13E21|nr:DUF930 domain-containing protein [Mesorhizobium sp. LHD-90]MDQ6434878.1 DUF930 domain-containing protein [Mesorhizobium sp. LHD-90]